MAKPNKTQETAADVTAFLQSFVDKEEKRQDSLKLIELMQQWSGHPPKMWGPSIIGFGSYHYKYASGHEGDSPLLGFSPRKAEFSLYVTVPGHDYGGMLERLGKCRKAKACIYFKRLSDHDCPVLERVCKITLRHHG